MSASGTLAVISKRDGSTSRTMGSAAPGSTRSPALCQRLATTPANGARTMARSARAVGRAARLLGLRERRRRFAQLALRVFGFLARRDAPFDQAREPRRLPRERSRRAPPPARWPRLPRTALAASEGMSNRTRTSPAVTRSPSAFGSAAIRAASGAVTVSSAPGAAVTRPVAAISSRMLPTVDGFHLDGDGGFSHGLVGRLASWQPDRSNAGEPPRRPGKRASSRHRPSQRALQIRERRLILEPRFCGAQPDFARRLQRLQIRGEAGLARSVRKLRERCDRRELRDDLVAVSQVAPAAPPARAPRRRRPGRSEAAIVASRSARSCRTRADSTHRRRRDA